MPYYIPSTQKEFESIAEDFLNKSLPLKDWTHEAHLITALWHIAKWGHDKALIEMRENIKAYNVSVGGMNTDSSGYHDTITVFWMWLLNEFWEKNRVDGRSFEEVCNLFLKSKYTDRNIALMFYSEQHLFSKKARLKCVRPDIQRLDYKKI